ncbi:MAG TPA: xanthine dehydrogenase family protein molybdopterin-binding subunit [Gaiellaceae bacterium]|jgi:carbon-monoxide dehydrogenase large subunit|nr:xanthine dehydrogenase family protein molybdopterin-binding subunit [Gaiellaceae bacterium]
MATTEVKTDYIGASVERKEDARLLRGETRWVDNMTLPGMLWMAVVRSPFAHAKITKVDLSEALATDGVVAAFSGGDLADEWAGSLPCAWPVTGDCHIPQHRPLTADKARYAGDGVAVVVAETRALAKDAAELVEVEYEPLPAVTDVGEAVSDSAPLVHDEYEENRAYTWTLQTGEIDELFSEAAVTVKERYRQQRLIPNAIEPRSVLVQPVLATDEYTMWSATQVPHLARVTLSGTTGIPETKLRVIAPDVGGGFGSKLNVYAEEALCLVLARRLGLPVKWTEERSENYVATIHGRDMLQEIELAANEDGKITAVRVRLTAAMGAYMQLVSPGIPLLGAWLYGGCYDVQAYDFECVGVFTNATPTDAYRGAGRPEATYAIERAVDALARKLDMDPVELRRKNFITEFPAPIASGLEIDSGDYHASLDKALGLVDYDGFRRDQTERRDSGDSKQIGIGLSTYVEMCGLAPSRILGAIRYGAGGWDAATIRCLPTGTVQVLVGTSPHGQGHVTTFSQIVADRLGVPIENVEVLHGDTTVVPLGLDTYGSRSLAVGGVALYHATEKVIAKAKRIVAHQLEVAEDDLEYEAGRFTVTGTDKSMTVTDAALSAWTAHNLPDGIEPGLEDTYVYDPPNFSWPAGCHIAVVEIDTESGLVELVRYLAVDDVGTVINPMIVDGQVHGGIAQGVAQALYEEAIYDDEGNLTTGSMLSYLVPSAVELPNFELERTESPSPTNPMGVKGVGETGTIASTAAVVNAIVDALSPYGVTDVEMPATPERVWRAIQEGGAS